MPAAVSRHINNGIKEIIKDTPKQEANIFKQVHNKIIGSNAIALKAATDKGKQSGYAIAVVDNTLQGDAAKVGSELVQQGKKYTGILPVVGYLVEKLR